MLLKNFLWRDYPGLFHTICFLFFWSCIDKFMISIYKNATETCCINHEFNPHLYFYDSNIFHKIWHVVSDPDGYISVNTPLIRKVQIIHKLEMRKTDEICLPAGSVLKMHMVHAIWRHVVWFELVTRHSLWFTYVHLFA